MINNEINAGDESNCASCMNQSNNKIPEKIMTCQDCLEMKTVVEEPGKSGSHAGERNSSQLSPNQRKSDLPTDNKISVERNEQTTLFYSMYWNPEKNSVILLECRMNS